MRHILEGYKWLWGAIRQWRGGAVWERALLFSGLVLRDLIQVRRRAAVLGGAALVGAIALGVLWPGHTKQRQHRIDIAMFADGRLHVNGEPSRLSDLEGLLAVQPVQFATVDAEGDVTMGALDEMQKLLVKHGIPRARLLSLERSRTGFGQAPRRNAP